MGYNFKPLEEYFHLIINKPRIVEFKEKSMLDLMKSSIKECEAKMKAWFTHSWEFVEEGAPSKPEIEDYWAFEIQTSAYECDGEIVEAQHDIVTDSNDTTWMETLDQILDVMGKHYGYNIKEQVYYSVPFPLNKVDERTGEPYAGYGRCLNDEVLQQLLLAFPELYESVPFGGGVKKGIFE